MKEQLKKGYYFAQKVLRKDARLLNKIKRERLTVVLNLHQVSPHQNPFWSPLSPEIFDDLLAFLKRHFEVVLFRELDKIESDKPLAVLSFDDGYYNFIEYAIPILEKHGLSVNMNIVPRCVESGEPMWNIKLYDFLNSAPLSIVNEIEFPSFDYKLGSKTKTEYGLRISRFLKNRPRVEREELWQKIESLMQKCDFQSTRMMNRSEIKEISGIHEIGVHSFAHESMEFEEDSYFEADLNKCLDYFKNELQIPLDVYAFPNGSYRQTQIDKLLSEGITNVLLVGEDFANSGTNVFPRFTIYGNSKWEARFLALGINHKI